MAKKAKGDYWDVVARRGQVLYEAHRSDSIAFLARPKRSHWDAVYSAVAGTCVYPCDPKSRLYDRGIWFSSPMAAGRCLQWKRERVVPPPRWRVWLFKLRRALPWR